MALLMHITALQAPCWLALQLLSTALRVLHGWGQTPFYYSCSLQLPCQGPTMQQDK